MDLVVIVFWVYFLGIVDICGWLVVVVKVGCGLVCWNLGLVLCVCIDFNLWI